MSSDEYDPPPLSKNYNIFSRNNKKLGELGEYIIFKLDVA